MIKQNLLIFTILMLLFQFSNAQNGKIEMPLVDHPVSDFSLIDQNGERVVFSELQGKNVMLIFPRGMVSDDHWCQICHYQYAELVDLEKTLSIREKYNLEVLFVLPYSRDSVAAWVEMFPQQLKIIHDWKNPDTTNSSEKALNWAKLINKILPKEFNAEKGGIDILFPVLADDQQLVSKGFKLYDDTKIKAPQNEPAVYILNSEGVVKFKYVSQNTFDRPSFDYLFTIIEKIVL